MLYACCGVSKSIFKSESILIVLTGECIAEFSPKKLYVVGTLIVLIQSFVFAVSNAVFSALVTNCTKPVPVVASIHTWLFAKSFACHLL